MNINNTISVSQEINLADLGLLQRADAVCRSEVSAVYDALMAQINALSGVVEILGECGSTNLDAGKLYFLLAAQEQGFNGVLADLEQLL